MSTADLSQKINAYWRALGYDAGAASSGGVIRSRMINGLPQGYARKEWPGLALRLKRFFDGRGKVAEARGRGEIEREGRKPAVRGKLLAFLKPRGWVGTPDIIRRIGADDNYLRQMLRDLKDAGVLECRPTPGRHVPLQYRVKPASAVVTTFPAPRGCAETRTNASATTSFAEQET